LKSAANLSKPSVGAGTVAIAPLRHRTRDGAIYVRPHEVQAEIAELLALAPDGLMARCRVRRRADSGYVRSECLVHLVRGRSVPLPMKALECVFRELLRRVLAKVWSSEEEDRRYAEAVREELRDQFQQFLAHDGSGYADRLDYFEMRFDSGLAKLRMDAAKKVGRAAKRERAVPLAESESGEFTEEVERGLRGGSPIRLENPEDPDSRSRLDAAIDGLPTLQQQILHMYRQDIPFESQTGTSMQSVLNKDPKTLRKHYLLAVESLRVTLGGDTK
jgi:hypothetical protein